MLFRNNSAREQSLSSPNSLASMTREDSSSGKIKLFSSAGYSKYANYLLLAYCLCAALSIALSQFLLGVLLLYWLSLSLLKRLPNSLRSFPEVAGPMLQFSLVALVSALLGIAPLRSLAEGVKSLIFLLLPFAVLSAFSAVELSKREFIVRLERYLCGFLLGQSLASAYTILQELFSNKLPECFPGAVTESGQLVLIIPLLFAGALGLITSESFKAKFKVSFLGLSLSPYVYAGVYFISLLITAWPGAILLDEQGVTTVVFRLAALVFSLVLAVPLVWTALPELKERLKNSQDTTSVEIFRLIWPASALLFAALILNLKRGPWLGVFVELLILGFIFSQRLVFAVVTLSFLVLLLLSPARTRVANFDEHFSISGGRKVMWELGSEISQRFPLGIGLNNARFMQELDSSIPPTHRHMHNNLLNVLVEMGWLGLGVYLWWMFRLSKFGWGIWQEGKTSRDRSQRQLGISALCLTLGIFGWQVAGLVEYNFGDGEIRLIALSFVGFLMAIKYYSSAQSNSRAKAKR